MGFETVYQLLAAVFPQVDARILKAVAIENSKNVEAAVEIVLSEVLPYLSQQSMISNANSANNSVTVSVSSEGEDDQRETGLVRRRGSGSGKTGMSNVDGCHAGKEDIVDLTADLSVDADIDHDQFKGTVESNEVILFGEPQSQFDNSQLGKSETNKTITESSISAAFEKNPVSFLYDFQDANTSFGNEIRDFKTYFEHEAAHSEQTEYLMQENDGHHVVVDNVGTSSGHELIQETNRIHPTVEKTEEEDTTTGSNHVVASCEDTPSNHLDKILLLEQAITDAKNNKKILFSAMESIMTMMRKVELEEKEAELAKEEASRGGMDILKKVEDLKPMLEHAKEANNMHAGEVYGEKAILATELRELQFRLLSLSNERDEGLAILDEMRQTLEERLTRAEDLKRLAEQEKREKEEAALKLLAEQEAIMEKVVQEFKLLQQEAEENSKLRQFLMDRGQVVDTLQGEISVIIKDVRLLKEKFDERVPLDQSISSSQTSCLLASSGSSLKSTGSDHSSDETSDSFNSASASSSSLSRSSVDRVSEKMLLGEGNTPSAVDNLSPKKREGAANDDDKELADEGWEFCN